MGTETKDAGTARIKTSSLRQLPDEQLAMLAQDGNSTATDLLMDRYKDTVRSKARTMYLIGGDVDDLIQEGMIGLFKAVRDFDPDMQAAFSTFAVLCINRQIYTAVQAYSRKKHSPLNTAVSLDYSDSRESDTGRDGNKKTLADRIADIQVVSPEEELIGRENVQLLLQNMDRLLSPMEKQVFALTITGISYTEIAGILGKSGKSIDNAQQRIRRKLKESLKEG